MLFQKKCWMKNKRLLLIVVLFLGTLSTVRPYIGVGLEFVIRAYGDSLFADWHQKISKYSQQELDDFYTNIVLWQPGECTNEMTMEKRFDDCSALNKRNENHGESCFICQLLKHYPPDQSSQWINIRRHFFSDTLFIREYFRSMLLFFTQKYELAVYDRNDRVRAASLTEYALSNGCSVSKELYDKIYAMLKTSSSEDLQAIIESLLGFRRSFNELVMFMSQCIWCIDPSADRWRVNLYQKSNSNKAYGPQYFQEKGIDIKDNKVQKIIRDSIYIHNVKLKSDDLTKKIHKIRTTWLLPLELREEKEELDKKNNY